MYRLRTRLQASALALIGAGTLLGLHPASAFPPKRPARLLPSKPSVAAQDILRKVEHAYATCRSYKDTETITTVFRERGKVTEKTTDRITTEFASPSSMRLVFTTGLIRGPRSQTVVCSDGTRVLFTTLGHVSKPEPENLKQGLEYMTQVCSSLTAAYMLLLPRSAWLPGSRDKDFRTFVDFLSPSLTGTSTIGKEKVWKISGRLPNEDQSEITVSVGRKDFLVRRVVITGPGRKLPGTYETYSIIATIRPELNVAIPAGTFSLEEKPENVSTRR